ANKNIEAFTANDDVVADATVKIEMDDTRRERRGVDLVVATEAYHEEIVGRLGTGDGHLCRKAGNRYGPAGQPHVDRVAGEGAKDANGVVCRIANPQIDCHLLDIGAGQIVDIDEIRCGLRPQFDALDIVEIHGDGADVAVEARAAAIGGDREGFRPG